MLLRALRVFVFCMIVAASSGFFPQSAVEKISWLSSYEEASSEGKPLFLYFPGEDVWSRRLEEEIFQDGLFQTKLAKVFHFVRLEKMPKSLPEFSVEIRPMVMLVDHGKVITQMGFLSVSAEEYGRFVLEFLEEYRSIQRTLKKDPPIHILEKLYEQAKHLGCIPLEETILLKGLEDSSGTYFLLEKYADLERNHPSDIDARERLRLQITQRDPYNLRKSFYRLAVLDFQYHSKHAEKSSDPKEIVKPLTDYVAKFPADDEHGWKVEMMISQYLFTKGLLNDALFHARACYKKAPMAVRKDIADSIQHIRGEIREERR